MSPTPKDPEDPKTKVAMIVFVSRLRLASASML